MAKDKIAYVCSECGQESAKWIGKCPNCHKWNTFKEIRISADTGTTAAKSAAQTLNAHRSVGEGHSHALRLRDIAAKEDPRIDTHDTSSTVYWVEALCPAASSCWVASLA